MHDLCRCCELIVGACEEAFDGFAAERGFELCREALGRVGEGAAFVEPEGLPGAFFGGGHGSPWMMSARA